MNCYYIRIESWGTSSPHIIDDEAMSLAELGMNYLTPDDFMFLCEAGSMAEAEEFYWEEASRAANDAFGERLHP